MASLIRRKNGTFYAQWKDADRNPVRRRLSLKTTNKRIARKQLTELDDAYRELRWDPWLQTIDEFYTKPAEFKTLGEVLELFMAAKRRTGLSESTLASYDSVLNRFVRSVGSKTLLERVLATQVASFAMDQRVAVSTQRLRYRILRAFLNWCDQEGHLQENPTSKVTPPKETERLPRVVRFEDLEAVCKALRKDYEYRIRLCDPRKKCREGDLVWTIPLFWFALYTGMRISEIARLRWSHIDRQEKLIYIHKQKNRKAQSIPLNSKAAAVLEGVAGGAGESEAYVFHAPRAVSVTKRSTKAFKNRVSQIFRRYRQEAELREGLTVHGLRHGFCTLLAEKGKSAVIIKAAARHADISTSMRYVSLSNQYLREQLEDVFG